jgi:hypothetical protein
MTDLSAIYVVEPDIPARMTIAEYRHARCRRLSRWRRLVLRVRVGAAVV